MVGYSELPLARTLGVRAGYRVLLEQAPDGFALVAVPSGVVVHARSGRSPYDVVVSFVRTRARLRTRLPAWENRIARNGCVWVAWPKKSSGVTTDMSESAVRELALSRGLVDVKVAAIDDMWSAVKLVIRLENR